MFVACKTGSGKSMCYQGLSSVASDFSIVLVISPLISLMDSQVNFLREHGISATYIGKDMDDNAGILRGDFSYVYASPEQVVSNKRWRDMLRSDIYRQKLVCIVFDEVHTAVSW